MSSRTCSKDQTKPQAMANAWTADRPWTYMKVEHTQGLGTIHLYLANIEAVGHGLEVREGVVWWWEKGAVYFGIPT